MFVRLFSPVARSRKGLRVKLQLAASLLLHTRSFFGYCSFFSFVPPPQWARTPFRLSLWVSVKLWLCIGPKWLMLDRRHPPAISWKGCASVCVLTLQAFFFSSQRYFYASAAARRPHLFIFGGYCAFYMHIFKGIPPYMLEVLWSKRGLSSVWLDRLR